MTLAIENRPSRELQTPRYGLTLTLLVALLLSGSTAKPSENKEDQNRRQAAAETEADSESKRLRIHWDDGLHLEGKNKNFTLKLGGSAQVDTAAFSRQGLETELGRLENGVEWRRARLYAEGVFARHFDYRFQYDFASNNPPQLKDAFIGFSLPFFPARIAAGRFRTILGLEGATNAPNTTFMERGLLSAFLPSRNTGFLAIREKSRIHWAVGILQPENQFGLRSTDEFGVSARVAYAFRGRSGARTVHIGGDFFRRNVKETIRFLERPESHIAPQFVDTGDFPAEGAYLAIGEFGWVEGPFSLQAEYGADSVDTPEETAGPVFHSWYVFASYFLTGEHRPYNAPAGAFSRVRPRRPFRNWNEGVGAFEIAFRFSQIDLNDKEIRGGTLNDFTAAFNWYPNGNARVMVNVIRAKRGGLDPIWIAQIRLQWAY